MNFHKTYGTEGPLGFPMTDKQARNLEAILKGLPKSDEFAYKKTVFHKAPTELNPGERSDVSWISTETVDRYGHVVFAKGTRSSLRKVSVFFALKRLMPAASSKIVRRSLVDACKRTSTLPCSMMQ
jgi:hypothetical protein